MKGFERDFASYFFASYLPIFPVLLIIKDIRDAADMHSLFSHAKGNDASGTMYIKSGQISMCFYVN